MNFKRRVGEIGGGFFIMDSLFGCEFVFNLLLVCITQRFINAFRAVKVYTRKTFVYRKKAVI